jgi:predicted membrane protein
MNDTRFQIVSVRWYLNKRRHRSLTGTLPNTPENSIDKKNHQNNNNNDAQAADNAPKSKLGRYIVIGLHYCQMGVLWRYAKLFIPVDLRSVKHEVRDLCMLRLVHAFCEAAPMLLLQLHVLVTLQNENMSNVLKLRSLGIGGQQLQSTLIQQTAAAEFQQKTFKDLNVVSAILSLFSVCWALASFSKNVRLQNVHRLVLTWLGVIFQFLWRLGTVISRIASLTVYCSVYSYWVFLVIGNFSTHFCQSAK